MKTPRLIEQIQASLAHLNLARRATLHVSIAEQMMLEELRNGRQVSVRWLCWSILDGPREVVPPKFDVACECVTREQLEAELPTFFPGLRVIVDHDIDMS